MNEEPKKQSDKWSTVRPRVDGRSEEFTGRKVSETTRISHPSEVETTEQRFTLYETPDEGYKLYVVETLYNAPDSMRRPERRPPEGKTTRVLYSEEEARQAYPVVLGLLLRLKEVKEKFGL